MRERNFKNKNDEKKNLLFLHKICSSIELQTILIHSPILKDNSKQGTTYFLIKKRKTNVHFIAHWAVSSVVDVGHQLSLTAVSLLRFEFAPVDELLQVLRVHPLLKNL